MQSPGHACAPEDASVKIPVVSAKWRSGLEAFAILEARFEESRSSSVHSGFENWYQRQLLWMKISLTHCVRINEIHGLQHLDNANRNSVGSDDIKSTHIYPKVESAPKVIFTLAGPDGIFLAS